jgi:hypothetical protein
MDNWDDEWNIPPTETDPLAQPNPKVYDINEEEEEEEGQDKGSDPEALLVLRSAPDC